MKPGLRTSFEVSLLTNDCDRKGVCEESLAWESLAQNCSTVSVDAVASESMMKTE